MRILAVTNIFPSPYLPFKAPFNRHQFRVLGERNAVRVIAPIAWTDEWRARRKGVPALPRNRRVELDGLVVEHPRFYFPPKILQGTYGRWYQASVGPTFRRCVAEFRPELIYATWAYPDGWAAVRLARRAGLPVVVQVHGSDILVLTKHAKRRRLTFDALRAADGVIAVSADLAGCAIQEGVPADRVRVVYGGVDAAVFHPGPKVDARKRLGLDREPDPLLLFVGNLLPVKGLDVLIDACAALARDGFRFRCHLIGQGPLAEPLAAQIERHGLTDRVKLLGPKPQSELPDWYRASDLFVLPSRSEGVPNVLREAAACGLRCVATRVGGIPEVSSCGDIRLVPAEDSAALAGAIRTGLAERDRPVPVSATRTRVQAISDLEEFLEGIVARAARREPVCV
jgi:glycosyltransferase involved in cell wall biosynthesis